MTKALIRGWAIAGAALCVLALPAQDREQEQAAPRVGPPNGSLVIVGSGMRDAAIRERFLRLAGGPDAPIVVIPTAGGRKNYDAYNSSLHDWKAAGARNLTVLHTTDPAVANTGQFAGPIRNARGVWFNLKTAVTRGHR